MLFIISFIKAAADLTDDYYIRQHDTLKYMATLTNTASKPLLVDFKSADLFKIVNSDKDSHEKIIYVNKMPNHVLDIAESVTKLIYYPFHGRDNQRFVIEIIDIGKKTYFIKNRDLCLEYNEKEMFFEKKSCDKENKNQIFDIISFSKIKEEVNALNACSILTNPELNNTPSKKYKEIKNLTDKFQDLVISNSIAANSNDVPKSQDSIKPKELEAISGQLNCMIKNLS